MPRQARDRQLDVLEALIRLFIERHEPVSSRMLEESGELDIKSASIRSVLHELERKGYLSQPHASSGRIPTDEGYRAFVDALRLDEVVDPLARAEVERAVTEAGADLDQLLKAMNRVLGKLSQNISILAGPRERSPRVVGVDLYLRDSRHVFVVVELEDGLARTELVRLDREVPPEGVLAAVALLGERLAGRTLEEVRAELLELVEHFEGPGEDIARNVALSARRLFDPLGLLRFSYEGLHEALLQPEFADPERLRALLEMMSRSEELEAVFERSMRSQPRDFALTIGHENPVPALQSFSLLTTRFDVGGHIGYFAVLGPRRMRYAQNASLIRLVARHLQQIQI